MVTAGPSLAVSVAEDGLLKSGSPQFSSMVQPAAGPDQEELDRMVAELRRHKDEWANLPYQEQIDLLDEVQSNIPAVADGWIATVMRAKGTSSGGFAEAEEWYMLAAVAQMVRLHRKTLADLRDYGRPQLPGKLYIRPNGQVAARVFPTDWREAVLFTGVTAEAWLDPSVGLVDAFDLSEPGGRAGSVTLVLGAGNVVHLPASDFLSKMFTDGQAILLKVNPVIDYMKPFYEHLFAPLIRRGFLQITSGGAQTGAYLCTHPGVDAIHLTGSDKTFDAIIFGPGNEGARRKAARTPLIDKPVTAELGGVDPLIIVPGDWTAGQLAQKSAQIATNFYVNAGFACTAPRLLIQHKSWDRRQKLIGGIGERLNAAGTRLAFYPGAAERYSAFLSAHPNSLQFGQAPDGKIPPGHLPWTLATDLDPTDAGNPFFTSEAFCSIFGETALEAGSIPEFIAKAVDFANDSAWGSLAAAILIHPRTLQEPGVKAALDDALERLRYGTITVNQLQAYAQGLAQVPWGAYPGHDRYDVRSGIGKVNNFYRLRRPQKSVLQALFTGLDPASLVHKNAAELGRLFAMQRLEGDSMGRFVRMAVLGLSG